MKRILSFILSLTIAFSIITGMDVSAFAADDFSLNKYLAEISLKGSYIPYKDLKNAYLDFESGCEVLVDAAQNTYLEEAIDAWYGVKTAANPGNALDSLNYQQQYEALLYSIIFDVLCDEQIKKYSYNNAITKVSGFTKTVVDTWNSADILDKTDLTGTESAAVKDAALAFMGKGNSKWTNLGEYADMVNEISKSFDEIIKVGKNVLEIIDRCCMLLQLVDSGDAVVGFLYDIKANADDIYLARAAQEVIDSIANGWVGMASEIVTNEVFSFGEKAIKSLVDSAWKKVCAINPFCKGMVVGDIVGTAASNALFATKDTVEQYSNMKKFVEVMSATRKAFISTASECQNNINDLTAAEWLFSCDFMYGLIAADYKCSVKFFEIVSTKGIVNKVKNLFGGSGYENYEKFSKSVNGFLNSFTVQYDGFCTGWPAFLEEDYPYWFEDFSQQPNNSFQTVVTKVTNVEFAEDEYELAMNHSVRIPVTVYPGTATDKSLTYSSSNENVVTVGYNGAITPVGEGTATIFVTSNNGIKDSCKITVYPYNVSENKTGYSITGYTGSDTHLSFPTEINDIEITAIGEQAFFDCDYIESVTFHEKIKRIEDQAFQNCVSLVSVTIPEHIEFLGERSFFSCDNLEKVTYNAKNCEVGLPMFTTSSSPFGKSDKLTCVEIGSSVEVLPDYIFHKCLNLTSIEIPDSVMYIGEKAILGTAYYNDESNWENGALYIDNHFIELNSSYKVNYTIKDGTKAIAGGAFKKCENLRSVTMPESLLCIGSEVFTNTSIESIVIPDSVTRIVGAAFQNCTTLESVKLSNNINFIEMATFSGCEKLKTIEIPEGVTGIDVGAFSQCTSLESIIIPNSVTLITMLAFSNCTNLKYVFYSGSETEWSTVDIATSNTNLTDAFIHYNSTDHTYSGPWSVEVAPKCTEEGSQSNTCVVCNDVISYPIQATGHSFSDAWTIDKEPTCAETGSKSHHCFNCDEKRDVTEIDVVPHSYGDWIISKEATCTTKGNKYMVCSVCSIRYGESIPATGHIYSVEWTVDVSATCSENGSKSHHCIYCDDKKDVTVIPATGHAYSAEWIIDMPATCSENGSKSHHCINCGDKKDVTVIPATGHNYSTEWTIDVEPTCTFAGSKSHHCLNCGDKKDVTVSPAKGHSFGEWVTSVEPTCTKTGFRIRTCSVCSKAERENLPALGHDYSGGWVIDVPASCTKSGSKSHHCANCGVKEDVTVIEATGHNYELESKIVAHPHTTTYNCSFCEDVKTESPFVDGCTECNFVVSAIDENSYKLVSYTGTATDVVIPSIYNGLPITRIENNCFKDNATIKAVVIPEGITSMGNAVFYGCTSLETVTIPSTVTNTGNATFYGCENLENVIIEEGVTGIGNSAFRGCTKLASVIIPKSVTSIGVSAFNGCSELKYIFYTGSETDWNSVTIGNDNAFIENAIIHYNATNHQYEEKVATQATCTEDGLVYSECIICGVKEKSVTIPAKGHKYSTEWTIDVEATCTTDGSKSHHCIACGDKADATVIEATGHNYTFEGTEEAHPHTTTQKCSFCNDEKKESSYRGDCVECNFTVSAIDENSYKLVSYIGKETEVVIPSMYNGLPVTRIEANCFKGNTTIKSVVIPEGITGMGNAVFYGCTKLESVVIPGSLTSIGNATFYNCTSLDSITISDGVTGIGNSAFRGCSALESIIIPESVITIGTQAFNGFVGTIYCTYDSAAHKYAVANNIKFIVMSVFEKESTEIDYENNIIKTKVESCSDISEVLGLSETANVVVEASHKYGNSEFYGTGTSISVFENDVYVCDFTLIVEGDANGDSVCDVLDCAQVERVSNGNAELTGAYAIAGDNNSDNLIDINDYQAIVNKAVS